VSASEEKSEAQQAFCNVKSFISFLRVGRFVDASEEKSECKLCEREGFTTSSSMLCSISWTIALPERSLIWLVVTDF